MSHNPSVAFEMPEAKRGEVESELNRLKTELKEIASQLTAEDISYLAPEITIDTEFGSIKVEDIALFYRIEVLQFILKHGKLDAQKMSIELPGRPFDSAEYISAIKEIRALCLGIANNNEDVEL